MTAGRDQNEAGEGWDTAIARLDGDLLQSWRWGAFKQQHGWYARHVQTSDAEGEAMAQVLFRRFGPFSIAYLPRGPVMSDPTSDCSELLRGIDELCRRQRAIVLVIEPQRPLPDAWFYRGRGFVRGPASFQTSRTVKVQLLNDEKLLAQMRKDTRYNIAHAKRNHVAVGQVPPGEAQIDTFYRLLRETSKRSGFGIHSRAYYKDFLDVFGDQAVLLVARVDGVATAGLIAARAGVEARSMYAGSSHAHRSRGDAALLRFTAMQWARENGCSRYDLGGIAPDTPPTGPGKDHVRTRSDLEGVHQFKTGFGGRIVTYPETVERRYRPRIAWLVRRLNARFRSAPERSISSTPETD